jgi:hypothetical protein
MTKSGMFLESKKRWVEFKQGYYNVSSKFKYFFSYLFFRVTIFKRDLQTVLHSSFSKSYEK